MTSPDAAVPQPWYDISTREDRRRVLRTLIKVIAALIVLCMVSDLWWPLPESLEQAVTQQLDALPKRKFWIGMTIGYGLLGFALLGLWQLWNFRPHGATFVAMYVFFPPFFVFPVAYTYAPPAGYFNDLASLATGMLLFLCWTQPDVFEPEPQANAPTTSSNGLSGTDDGSQRV